MGNRNLWMKFKVEETGEDHNNNHFWGALKWKEYDDTNKREEESRRDASSAGQRQATV